MHRKDPETEKVRASGDVAATLQAQDPRPKQVLRSWSDLPCPAPELVSNRRRPPDRGRRRRTTPYDGDRAHSARRLPPCTPASSPFAQERARPPSGDARLQS